MRKWMWCGFLSAVAVLGHSFWAFAEEQPNGVHRLDAIMVSATRTGTAVFDAPQSVTVITGEEIMASPFERVEDIVRSVPCIYNFRHYGLQTNGIVSPLKMRSVGSNRILVLVETLLSL